MYKVKNPDGTYDVKQSEILIMRRALTSEQADEYIRHMEWISRIAQDLLEHAG